MKKIDSYNVAFLGRTGNGKTSLINALFGTAFPTDAHVCSTKEMYTVTRFASSLPSGKEALTAIDTPGIGEFASNDRYYRFYEHAASAADCVVLVLTFDRTDAPSQRLLLGLKEILAVRQRRYVVALNHIDTRIVTDAANTYSPWDDAANTPTPACCDNIRRRSDIIAERYKGKFPDNFTIVPVCAIRNFGIDNLYNAIIEK